MQITLKLYASLAEYLPSGASKNVIVLDVDEGTTPSQVVRQFLLPVSQVHLVLLNGVYLEEAKRQQPMQAQDVLAIWPPVAGG